MNANASRANVGSIVYATDQGLGVLAKSFYDHGVFNHAMVVCHGRHPTHFHWYKDAEVITNLRDPKQQKKMEAFCARMDAMIFFETPFHWPCVSASRKSFLMPMYECMPEMLPYEPIVILNPSALDQRYYPDGIHVQVPVCQDEACPCLFKTKWKLRKEAKVFVHNAGHGGLKGRNGTRELLDALRYIRKPIELLLRTQDESFNLNAFSSQFDNVRIKIDKGNRPYDELYSTGDVFVFPEQFNGLSLPLQEAKASGMLVMATDRFPNNDYLSPYAPIPVSHYTKERIGPPYNEFDRANVDPRQLATVLDNWYGADISSYSLRGKEWADKHSWKVWKRDYLEILES